MNKTVINKLAVAWLVITVFLLFSAVFMFIVFPASNSQITWWMDRVVPRLEKLEKRPTFSQRAFERMITAHLIEQDRLSKPQALVIFGDSHLYFLPTHSFKSAHNFAIGGESAERIAKRMEQFGSIQNARAIVLGGGANDISEGKSIVEIDSSWTKMLAHVPKKTLLVCVGIPVNLVGNISRNEVAKQVNEMIEAKCKQRGARTVQILPGQGEWLKTGFREDGRHLDRRAYEQLVQRIEQEIGN
jgi:GDSL-like Lipase/Acylhydrolase family